MAPITARSICVCGRLRRLHAVLIRVQSECCVPACSAPTHPHKKNPHICLPRYLWSFRLPGEAQKIDRMMENFAKRFTQCNPGKANATSILTISHFSALFHPTRAVSCALLSADAYRMLIAILDSRLQARSATRTRATCWRSRPSC